MKQIITKEQQKEIVELCASGHSESIIGFGGDLYRQGLKQGSIYSLIGVGAMYFLLTAVEYVIKKTNRIKKGDLTRSPSLLYF